ncbi:MAG TPA: hypothetical protein DEP87_03995, partial [Candidatus Pacebacteria bacterium]|nr:hypothetical protein [Candidatus Paceibacterota bacterium]
MAKSNSVFVCQSCGASFPRWQGQCSSCNEWNSLVEEMAPTASAKSRRHGQSSNGSGIANLSDLVISLANIEPAKTAKNRFSTSLLELDRVLGGGLVPGAVLLLGGEPGIGKSTLLTQMMLGMLVATQVSETDSKKLTAAPILYVCGEESPSQIAMRIHRTKITGSELIGSQVQFVTTTDVDEIAAI